VRGCPGGGNAGIAPCSREDLEPPDREARRAALTWQGKRDVRVETVPDPGIEEPTDAIVRITFTAICGWNLHLYEILSPFLTPGDILGHEPMGSWRRSAPTCGRSGRGVAWWCRSPSPAAAAGCARGVCSRSARQLRSGTQGRGAAVFGSTSLYGAVPEIQLRMGQAHVKRWIEEIMPLVRADDDPLGVLDLTTHRLPLEDAARGYEMFRRQQDDCIKVVLHPAVEHLHHRQRVDLAAIHAAERDGAAPPDRPQRGVEGVRPVHRQRIGKGVATAAGSTDAAAWATSPSPLPVHRCACMPTASMTESGPRPPVSSMRAPATPSTTRMSSVSTP